MMVGADGARNDLAKLGDVTSFGAASLGSTLTPPTHAQPTGQEGHGEGQSGGRRGRTYVAKRSHSRSGGSRHHVVASLAAGRGAAPGALEQLRATLAANPTAAKLATIDDPP